jgi:hypothetical protein
MWQDAYLVMQDTHINVFTVRMVSHSIMECVNVAILGNCSTVREFVRHVRWKDVLHVSLHSLINVPGVRIHTQASWRANAHVCLLMSLSKDFALKIDSLNKLFLPLNRKICEKKQQLAVNRDNFYHMGLALSVIGNVSNVKMKTNVLNVRLAGS